MAHRNKNLLEAFTASRAEERASAPRQESAGGPFAAPPAPKAPARPAQPDAQVRPAPRASAPPGQLAPRHLLIAVAIAAACFLLGRWSASGVAAATPDSSPPANPAEVSPPATATLAPNSASTPVSSASVPSPEQALMDKRNRYTLVAAQYSPSAQEIALAAQKYLASQGFPAAAPYQKGKSLYLLVGAAASMQELDTLLARLKKLSGPGGRPDDFKTALAMPIDQIVQRN